MSALKARAAAPNTATHAQRRGDESAELKQLRAANRDLVRQKAEVVSGFKAALKLVDVLKRQKVHVSLPCSAP